MYAFVMDGICHEGFFFPYIFNILPLSIRLTEKEGTENLQIQG